MQKKGATYNRCDIHPQTGIFLRQRIESMYLSIFALEPGGMTCPYERSKLNAAVEGVHEVFGENI